MPTNHSDYVTPLCAVIGVLVLLLRQGHATQPHSNSVLMAQEAFGAASLNIDAPPAGPPYVNCPYRPRRLPDSLPSPLPQQLSNAFAAGSKGFDRIITGENGLVSGIITFAYKGKTIFSHGAGETKKGNGIKPTENTLYRIGSVSKIFPCLQLYMLATDPDSGVALDDTLEMHGHNVSFYNPFPPHRQPTLLELSSQQSGLPRTAPCGRNPIFPSDDVLCGRRTPAEVAEYAKKTVLMHPPGVVGGAALPSYSNMAYSMLGHEIVPKSDKWKNWEEWVQVNILNPLNLTRTGFELPLDGSLEDVATGYESDGRAVGTYYTGYSMPSGGMHSSTRDLNALADAIMSGTLFLNNSDMTQQFLSAQYMNTGGGAVTAIGSPWEFQLHNKTGFYVRRKGGNVPGYASIVALIPSLRLSFSMLISVKDFDEFTLSWNALDAVLEPFVAIMKDFEKSQGLPQPDDAKDFVGKYATPIPGDPKGLVAQISQVQIPNTTSTILLITMPGLGNYALVSPNWKDSTGQLSDRYLQLSLAGSEFLTPCLNTELAAFDLSYVVFKPDLSSFKIPGLFDTNITFTRLE